jgi:hypothetical protein
MKSCVFFALACGALGSVAACDNKTPEPKPDPVGSAVSPSTAAVPTSVVVTAKKDDTTPAPSSGMSSGGSGAAGKPGSDPNKGSFTLAEATKDV